MRDVRLVLPHETRRLRFAKLLLVHRSSKSSYFIKMWKINLKDFQKIRKVFSTYSFHPYKGKKNFRYLTPRELYGHNSLKIKRGRCDVDKCKDQMIGANGFEANAPLTGFLDCQIRHSASNYQGWFLKIVYIK